MKKPTMKTWEKGTADAKQHKANPKMKEGGAKDKAMDKKGLKSMIKSAMKNHR